MSEHTLKAYDQELSDLKAMLAQMGGLLEQQLADALQALSQRDTATADAAIKADEGVDLLERLVEEKAITTIARRQPVAADLREIIVAIRTASDFERIGDLAKNTAKRVHAMPDQLPTELMSGILRMGEMAEQELTTVLDSYARADGELALQVWRADESLDALYNSVFRELLTYMMEDPRNISLCTHLLFAAKNLERIGDHATNIAENIHYLVTGMTIAESRPKMDLTSGFRLDTSHSAEQ